MRESDFRKYLDFRGLSEKTISMCNYALKRVERAYSIDLDKEYRRDNLEALIATFTYSMEDERAKSPNPSKMDMDPTKLYSQLAWYRNKIRYYMAFCAGSNASLGDAEQDSLDDYDGVGRTFALERDLQAALRANIQQLESGLVVADDGIEARVEAGLIDILAKDSEGRWVVIELKADVARPAAATQLLAYMACIAAERQGEVRGVLVASDFDRKIILAARALPTLVLKRYRFQFAFE
jgi:hypothetical protein